MPQGAPGRLVFDSMHDLGPKRLIAFPPVPRAYKGHEAVFDTHNQPFKGPITLYQAFKPSQPAQAFSR